MPVVASSSSKWYLENIGLLVVELVFVHTAIRSVTTLASGFLNAIAAHLSCHLQTMPMRINTRTPPAQRTSAHRDKLLFRLVGWKHTMAF